MDASLGMQAGRSQGSLLPRISACAGRGARILPAQAISRSPKPSQNICSAPTRATAATDIGQQSAEQLLRSGPSALFGDAAAAQSPPGDFDGIITPRRTRVAVDVDEVLGRFLYALNAFREERHELTFDVSDYHVYDFATVWQCSKDESNHIVHEFFQSQHFADGIPVIPGALDSLTRLALHFELVVVTSRQHAIRDPTLAWLQQHFPGVFSEVHFGNHYALTGASKTKSEICREVGASVLIDDNPIYALECAAAGLHVLLYDWNGGYPWSKTDCGPSHPNIVRVSDWDEVERALALLAERQ